VAALAHALGPLIAIIVWATQKDKSPFLKRHLARDAEAKETEA